MSTNVGVPIKVFFIYFLKLQLIHEAQGHIVTVEVKAGSVYRGKLLDAEDSMNLQLKDIACTGRDGRVTHLDQIYIRGSQIRFIVVPDMLKNAPMFKKMNERGSARGGRARGSSGPSRGAGRGGMAGGRGR
jgi:small nuclear ribonucleoprotein D3